MKIAVTAASGRLGSTILRELHQKPENLELIGLARTPEKAKHLGIGIFPGDYNQKAHFVEAFQGVDAVLLISGMDAPDKRIIQHRNVIEAAREAGVKKIVYTSIIGKDHDSAFNAIVQSNRQTEQDIKDSGMDWAIGRNGLYIEADLDYIPNYLKLGRIENCAGQGKCGYTSRLELTRAYAEMLLNDDLTGDVYNLCGNPVTQYELTDHINKAYKTKLEFHSIDTDAFMKDRQNELGEFLGMVIAGIYTGIQEGAFNISSDYEKVMKRQHQSLDQMIEEYRKKS